MIEQIYWQLDRIKYGKIELLVRKKELFVFYATFIANENYKLMIRPGDTVLDFGANIGDFTLKAYSMLRGKGRLIAIEPSHENIEILKANLEHNNIKNVEVYECAISDSDGFVYLEGEGGVGSHISYEKGKKRERVKAYSIETFLAESELKNQKDIVVKMDIEGAEKYALNSRKFIENIREISIELHGNENVKRIPKMLAAESFKVSQYNTFDEVKETIKAIVSHPVDFLKLEKKSGYLAFKGFLRSMYYNNPVPSIGNPELKMIYASRKI